MQKELSDFKLVAALLANGQNYSDCFRQGSRVVFTFEWNPAMQELENRYWDRKLPVDAQTYGVLLGDVKKIIYSQVN